MAAKTQAHKAADKRIKDLEAAMKTLEDANENLIQELTKARQSESHVASEFASHMKSDAEAAFRTVEIFVYNDKRKNTSRQYFGIAEGDGLRFSVDATGHVHTHSDAATKAVSIS